MKTILITTDYSEEAKNALYYGIELAKLQQAKVILFHSYHIRTLLSSLTLINGGFKEENLEKLGKLAFEVKRKVKNPPEIELKTSSGFAVENILKTIDDENADLVVMGLKGAGMRVEVLIGDTTTSVIAKAKVPVLVVPNGVNYKKPEKMVLVYDHKEAIPDKTMDMIKEYVKLFEAKLLMLNIVKQEEVVLNNGYSDVETYLDETMKTVNHELFSCATDEIEHDINAFVKIKKGDLLVMIPHGYELLEAVFKPDNTQKMVFHTQVPLLSIPD